jgi:serine/threonine protein phosphatase PrpC
MLRDALINAGIAVNNEAKGGITTGTIVKLVESPDGKNYAVWASIGDSPLMVFNRRTSSLIRISTDEILSPEKPNVITNAIGHKLMEIRQIGHFELHDGDELVLCSDGITGDRHPDILLDSEISSALANAANTQQAAESLIADSRKRDDKAVLVIRP